MKNEFSAKHFADMSADKFAAEAKRLGVDLYGKSRTQQIDAVYNAELRRRQEQAEANELDGQAAAEEQVKDYDKISAYDEYTVAELRDMADERGVDLGSVSRKADIIAALEAADADEAKG